MAGSNLNGTKTSTPTSTSSIASNLCQKDYQNCGKYLNIGLNCNYIYVERYFTSLNRYKCEKRDEPLVLNVGPEKEDLKIIANTSNGQISDANRDASNATNTDAEDTWYSNIF